VKVEPTTVTMTISLRALRKAIISRRGVKTHSWAVGHQAYLCRSL
jgi:hypothetical protein